MFSHCRTPEEVKKEYRKLAFKHHPDRGGDSVLFMEVSKNMHRRIRELTNPQPQMPLSMNLPPGVTEKLVVLGIKILDSAMEKLKQRIYSEFAPPIKHDKQR